MFTALISGMSLYKLSVFFKRIFAIQIENDAMLRKRKEGREREKLFRTNIFMPTIEKMERKLKISVKKKKTAI